MIYWLDEKKSARHNSRGMVCSQCKAPIKTKLIKKIKVKGIRIYDYGREYEGVGYKCPQCGWEYSDRIRVIPNVVGDKKS